MELVNTTRVPAELLVSELSASEDESVRLGSLVAKATFEVEESGRVRLSEDPLPLLRMEEQTELGLLPRDFVPPRPPGLDVMVLAAAYAPDGRPTPELNVTLKLGEHRWRLLVTGDRRWARGPEGWVIGPPAEFVRMPLTWSRAFGGKAEVWIDGATPIDVQHPFNPEGRGFDAAPHMEGLERALGCPAGFPRLNYERMAPNVERVAHDVASGVEDPEPYCWAPLAIDFGLRAKWGAEGMEGRPPDAPLNESVDLLGKSAPKEGMWFGHRDLRVPVPEANTRVEVTNAVPRGRFRFGWPSLQVSADYVSGGRSGTRELEPQMVALLPDQRSFCVTYRTWFRFKVSAQGSERSLRLRTTD